MNEVILTDEQRASNLFADRLDQLKERLMEYDADLVDMVTPDGAAESYRFSFQSHTTPATEGAGGRIEITVKHPTVKIAVWAYHEDSRKWLPIWTGVVFPSMGQGPICDAFDRAEAVLALINAV